MTNAEKARQLVAQLLNGDLETTIHTAQGHVMRFANPVMPLRHSPATSVTTVTVAGVVQDPSTYTFTPFTLVREPASLGVHPWPTGVITVSYTTGWDEGYEPDAVRAALELAESYLASDPGSGITSFKEGAEAVTVNRDEALGAIRRLLSPWVRP